MKIKPRLSKDPDLAAAGPALKRAAKAALELARRTNTPCWVMKDGKLIDLAKRNTRRKTS